MSRFYFLIAKTEPGCPAGDRGFILLKDMSAESREHYGLAPWYTGPKKFGGQLQPFPKELVLMTNRPRSRYDVAQVSSFFYVLSKRVVDVISCFNTTFVDVVPVRYVNMSGVSIPGCEYFVGATKRLRLEDVCDWTRTKRGGRFGLDVLSVGFKEEVEFDLFDLYDTSGSEFSLVASERLMLAMVAAGVKGVEFCEVENFQLKTGDECQKLNQRYYPV